MVVYVNLPTSTKFNKISWDESKRLSEIKLIDNLGHDGVVRHENLCFEKVIATVLDTFYVKLFNKISEGLAKFPHVALTADHGFSKLAVLAHQKKLDKTLLEDDNVDDWRYTKAPADTNTPKELEHAVVLAPDQTIRYWVVRGYNRLSKKGSKMNELHGGASLEERLVPLIVFSRSKTAKPSNKPANAPAPQIIEDLEFDI
jgi:hypothetical protein